MGRLKSADEITASLIYRLIHHHFLVKVTKVCIFLNCARIINNYHLLFVREDTLTFTALRSLLESNIKIKVSMANVVEAQSLSQL